MAELKTSLSDEDRLLLKYAAVFGTPDGEDVLEDILRHAYFEKTTLVPGDPCHSAAKEGARMNALEIKRRVERGKKVRKPEEPNPKAISNLEHE